MEAREEHKIITRVTHGSSQHNHGQLAGKSVITIIIIFTSNYKVINLFIK